MKIFKFKSYEFSNQLDNLERYLIEKNIIYKKNKVFLRFQITNEDCSQKVEVKAYYLKNTVYRIMLYFYPIAHSNMMNLIKYFEDNFTLINKDVNKSERVFNDGYDIFVTNSYYLTVDVRFEVLTTTLQKIERNDMRMKVVSLTIVGILMSALFIFLYFKFKEYYLLSILTAIIALIYAFSQVYFIYIKDACLSKSGKKKVMIVVPILFVAVVAFTSFFLAVRVTDGDIKNQISKFSWLDIIMVFIYLCPSFHILVLLLALASYA